MLSRVDGMTRVYYDTERILRRTSMSETRWRGGVTWSYFPTRTAVARNVLAHLTEVTVISGCLPLSQMVAGHTLRHCGRIADCSPSAKTTIVSLWQQSKDHLPTGDDHQEEQVIQGSKRSRTRPGGRQPIKMFVIQSWTQLLSRLDYML